MVDCFISPIGPHVVLKMVDIKQKTAGGIILPQSLVDAHRNHTEIGQVAKLGGGAFKNRELYIEGEEPKIGDFVYFEKNQGLYTKDSSGHEFRIVWDADVKAIADRQYIEQHYEVM